MDNINYGFKKPRVNEVIEGTVVKVDESIVYLDINYITEGTIHKDKFTTDDVDLRSLVKVGDRVKAVVKDLRDEEHTYVLMSRLPLIKEEKFGEIKKAYHTHKVITAKIVKAVNKGLVATYLGHEIFIPDGQIELEDVTDKNVYLNKELELKITEIDEKGRVIGSHRSVLWDEYKKARQAELDSINVGDVLTGTVHELRPYGALIKFNYNQGLLRIGNVSHIHIENLSEVLSVGDKIEVKVITKDGNKIDLSKKALLKTPYEIYAESHKVGDKVVGKVNQKLPFGIIITLDENVTGLLHKNEISWNPNDNFEASVKIGDEITTVINKIDVKGKKVSLSKKALEDNPWARVDAKVGDITKAKVTGIVSGKGLNITCFGVDGFIPVNELSNRERIAKIEDRFAVGDEVEGRVIELNKAEWVLKLSIKRLEAEIERKQFEEYQEDEAPSVTLGDRYKDLLK